MSADPVIPTGVPPVTLSGSTEPDVDPDALEDEDFREEQEKPSLKEWDEPPSSPADVPEPDQPTPLSDDLR